MPQSKAPPPDHVDPALVRDYDMFDVAPIDGDIQLGLSRHLGPDAPRVFWTQANGGHWVLTRAEDIEFALRTPEIFSSTVRVVPKEKNPDPPMIPIMLDPPALQKYRALLWPAFTPEATEVLGERARAVALRLVEDLVPRGRCEFMSDFAKRLPIEVFMGMLDLPGSDRETLLEVAENFVRPASPADFIASVRSFQDYARGKIGERRARPGPDLISQLIASEVDGRRLDDAALVGIIVLLLAAGLDTVAAQLGFFARFLALNPGKCRALRDDPGAIPRAIEELMRRYPIATVSRLLMRDHAIGGVTMRRGDMASMPLGFVNFDAERFPRPFEIDFGREGPVHAGFGLGVHRCMGAGLARLELRIFLETWLARIPDFAIDPAGAVSVSSGTITGIRSLPLTWRADDDRTP